MRNVTGVGLDLCAIPRMQELLDSGRSLRRMFSEEEERYIRSKGAGAAQTMAGIFAAKEAILTALGTGLSVPMTDVCIRHTELGQPQAILTGKAGFGGEIQLSITHEGDMAAAVALLYI
ncbi:MAG: holo-ACP synthase [Clostridia bacterium]|nr:holo-ACP synthase [Clostridia bacterium]